MPNETTAETKKLIELLSAKCLPNSPSEAGMKPEQIKKYFYRSSELIVEEIDRVVKEINNDLSAAKNFAYAQFVNEKTAREQADIQVLSDSKNYTDTKFSQLDLVKIVSVLPPVGERNIIYFVPKTTTEVNDVFNEYIYENNSYEYVGSQTIGVDLAGYYTIKQMSELLSEKQNIEDASLATKSKQITSAINEVNSQLINQVEQFETQSVDALINGTNVGIVDVIEIYGNSIQGANPSVDSAQSIFNVTSQISINTQNKNLFNYEGINKTVFSNWCANYIPSETYVIANGFRIKGRDDTKQGGPDWQNGWLNFLNIDKASYIPLKAGQTVTVSADVKTIELLYPGSYMNLYLYSNNNTSDILAHRVLPFTLNETKKISHTFTIPKDNTYYPVFTINSNTVEVTNIQIEYGNAVTAYIPYEEQATNITVKDTANTEYQLKKVGNISDRIFKNKDGIWKIELNTNKSVATATTLTVTNAKPNSAYLGSKTANGVADSNGVITVKVGEEVVYILNNSIISNLNNTESVKLEQLRTYEEKTKISSTNTIKPIFNIKEMLLKGIHKPIVLADKDDKVLDIHTCSTMVTRPSGECVEDSLKVSSANINLNAANIATKANSLDVYTRIQSDEKYATKETGGGILIYDKKEKTTPLGSTTEYLNGLPINYNSMPEGSIHLKICISIGSGAEISFHTYEIYSIGNSMCLDITDATKFYGIKSCVENKVLSTFINVYTINTNGSITVDVNSTAVKAAIVRLETYK